MKYRCRECGKEIESGDPYDFYCQKCEDEGKAVAYPNDRLLAETRIASEYGKTYGKYQGLGTYKGR